MKNTFKIGVTGTREGATPGQLYAVATELYKYHGRNDVELHHGDCAGVDVQVAAIARAMGFKIVCHPPTSDYLRGFFESDEVRAPLGYLVRDRNIAVESDLLLVVPLHNEPQHKGGTWYTYRCAIKDSTPVKIFYPKDCQSVGQ